MRKHFIGLKGKWNFQRRVNDLDAMSGHALFEILPEQPSFYWYFEEGIYKNLNQTFFREYIYCFENADIFVFLARAKKKLGLLYKLEFISDIQATGQHLCEKDRYQALYTFQNNKQFKLKVRVNGPRKNDLIETVFNKSISQNISL